MSRFFKIFLALLKVAAAQVELPLYTGHDPVYSYAGFTLCYSEEHEQALWVAYELTAIEVSGTFPRSDNFYDDQRIKSGSATLADYRRSGYDRGHLAPAADMKWSRQAMLESFSLANMSPQKPAFNRGIWKNLEELVRSFAMANEAIYVVTGPLLSDPLPKLGPSGVSIPNAYYKVILDYREPQLKAIGFLLEQDAPVLPLESFIFSIDAIERITGLDFFPSLPDSIEQILESRVDPKLWQLQDNAPARPDLCRAITRKGTRCTRVTKNENGYCWQHQ